MNKTEYTGTQVNYYFVCKRKLWLFSKHIQMEHTSDTVKLGKLTGEESYKRENKEVQLDDTIAIDFLEMRNNKIHEVKKSRAVEQAHIWQVKYYLYFLKQKGMNGITGEINYPLLRKTLPVTLTAEDENEIERILADIAFILSSEKMPDMINQKFCRKCSYYGFCWV
ncbi:MAG: CRISPR-associated protein Cas4 [Calditrichaceae bacterium]|nr:CRISPR-associated protein Cas4 [Calditrichaceae bacterium]MBN2708718.1 CRISPR-associated protein Cas4 [Calditrichaceae bacterium]RQV92159.1 MAG: CRISPR-associated protein Cas4 [Calditrichota bacterium]